MRRALGQSKIIRDDIRKRQSRVSKHKVIIRPMEERIPVPTPTIVDPAIFASAQTRLAARDYTGRQKYHYLVSGRVKCTCGFAMHGCTASFAGRDKVYQYYKCNSSREASGQCGAPKFRQDAVDATVWRFTLELLRDPEKLLKGYREAQQDATEEHATINRQLDQIDTQIQEYDETLVETLEDKRRTKSDSLKIRLAQDAERIGELIDNLKKKRDILAQSLTNEGITDEFITDTVEFMEAMREELADIDETADHEAQRVIVSRLNLRIILRVTNEQKWVDIQWLRKVYPRVCEEMHKSL